MIYIFKMLTGVYGFKGMMGLNFINCFNRLRSLSEDILDKYKDSIGFKLVLQKCAF